MSSDEGAERRGYRGRGGVEMPLSEDEQRILRDIEKSFYETDPEFARSVSSATIYEHARRSARIAAAGFVVSFVALLATFTQVPLLALVFFVGMVASALVFAQSRRRVGASRTETTDIPPSATSRLRTVGSRRPQAQAQLNERLQELLRRFRR